MSKIQQQSGSRREQQPCSASFVRLFQHRISLRAWTEKPYRSKQRVLAEGTITEVSTVWLGWNALIVSDRVLTQAEWDAFARADGFADSVEMHGWFLKTHGIPVDGWRGILIRWQNDERVHHYQRRRTSITGLGL
jgi:hypothetical protein